MTGPARQTRSFRRRAALALAGILGSLLLVEASLRVAGVVLRRHDDRRAAAGDARADAARGTRVLCLGSCYTVGVGVGPEDAYPAQLELLLNAGAAGADAAVFNRGVRGQNLSYFVNRLERLVQVHRPRFIILNVSDREAMANENMLLANKEAFPLRDRMKTQTRLWLDHSKVFRMARLLMAPDDAVRRRLYSDLSGEFQRESAYASRLQRLRREYAAHPESGPVRRTLAKACAEQGLYQEAAGLLAAVPRPDLEQYRELFLYRIQAGDYGAAAELPGRFAAERPDLAAALRAESARGGTDREPARWDPESWLRWRRLPLDLGLLGEYGKAAEICRRMAGSGLVVMEIQDLLGFFEAQAPGAPSGEAPLQGFYKLVEDMYLTTPSPAVRPGVEGEKLFERVLRYDLKKALKITRGHGATVILENLGSTPEQQAVIRRVCAELSVPLLDLRQTLLSHPSRASLYLAAPKLRLNREGHRVVAQEILKALTAAARAGTPAR